MSEYPPIPKPTPEYLIAASAGLALFLMASAAIGMATRKRRETFESFLVGHRDIGPVVTGLALCATWMSGWALLGLMGITYMFGWPGMWLAGVWTLVGLAPAALLTGLKMRMYSSKFGAATVPEVVRIRFDSKLAQSMAGLIMVTLLIVYAVGQFKAGATVWYAVTGYPWEICILLSAIVVLVYLAIGGYTGTQWALAFQGFLLALGSYALGFVALAFIGGPAELNAKLAAQSPALTSLINPALSKIPKAQFAADFIGVSATALLFFTMAIGFPHNVARFLGMRRITRREFAIMMLVITIAAACPWANLITGLAARAYWGPTLLKIPFVKADGAAPFMAMVAGGVPLATLYMVAVFSAALSTLAATVMIMAGNITRDLIQTYRPQTSPTTLLLLTRILIAIFVLIPLYWALVKPPALLAYLMAGAAVGLGSIFFFVIAVSMYWKRATKWGAISCMAYGMIMVVLGGYYVYTINQWGWGNWVWATFTGCAILYFAVSLLTKPLPEEKLSKLFPRKA
ncbi:MAG: hypothetical protein DRJ31_05340 [Candidatus Methanomethylicota archaeon]|uniref:Sodium:solute symporter family protein n=1 Tax=Thermoproteota archaeon TaxID=2056631 RepID=A0A497ERV0_9CREN|nr:MAG: hypothetical protein DRJ31_05340 [Candidatus Verstraetearchaeota archaeon]RLE52990.1 MAG: hypothetical protein DRJ33_02210 [Candidatus Verstraetearchaeota archaeon]